MIINTATEPTSDQLISYFYGEANYLVSIYDNEYYNQVRYLPESLQKELTIKLIFQINRTIGILLEPYNIYSEGIPTLTNDDEEPLVDDDGDESYKFDREFIVFMQWLLHFFDFDLHEEYKKELHFAEIGLEHLGVEKFKDNLIWFAAIDFERKIKEDYCKSIITIHEIDNNSTLEKFEDLIYFFGLILFYRDLLYDAEIGGGKYLKARELIFSSPIIIEKGFDEIEKPYEQGMKEPPHFTRAFTPEQLKQLYTGLTEGEFLPIEPTGADYRAFCYVFGGKGNAKNFKPLKWIKTSSTTHGKTINKKSLLNLLELLNIPNKQIREKKLLNKLFIKQDGKSIKFTGSNYTGTQLNFNSEYHIQLQKIVSTIK